MKKFSMILFMAVITITLNANIGLFPFKSLQFSIKVAEK